MGEPRLPHFIGNKGKLLVTLYRTHGSLGYLAFLAALGLAAPLSPALACDSIELHGVLAARFADSTVTYRGRLDYLPSSPEGSARIRLRRRHLACDLILAPPAEGPAETAECTPAPASGTLSCDDGREWRLAWRMTSNRGGLGYSINEDLPGFAFGFSSYLDGALDQLEKAREGRQE